MDIKSKPLFVIMVLLALLSIGFTYYKTIITEDFEIIDESVEEEEVDDEEIGEEEMGEEVGDEEDIVEVESETNSEVNIE